MMVENCPAHFRGVLVIPRRFSFTQPLFMLAAAAAQAAIPATGRGRKASEGNPIVNLVGAKVTNPTAVIP
jgi:hypothetical protein